MSAVKPIAYDDLPSDLKEQLRTRVDRLGYLGDWFRCTAHQPTALSYFVSFTETLKEALDPDVVETIALTAASKLGNSYEQNQHEQLARKSGRTDAWIRALVEDTNVERELTPLQYRIYQLTVATIDRTDPGGEMQSVVNAIGEVPAVAVLLLIARFVAHSVVASALQLEPPVPSIFDAGGEIDAR